MRRGYDTVPPVEGFVKGDLFGEFSLESMLAAEQAAARSCGIPAAEKEALSK